MTTLVEQIAETTIADFEERLRDKPLVIIYPRHRSRSALVALFLQHYAYNVIYYNLSRDDQTLTDWLAHLVDDPIFPVGFGRQTRAALSQQSTPEEYAAALGADLSTLRAGSFMLLLDSFDRLVPSKETDRFFRALPAAMPSHAQIVINARLLALQPWDDLVKAGQAGVVGDDRAVAGGIYGTAGPSVTGHLEVLALSGGHVYVDGQPVDSWDGSLPKHLFYFFVDHPMVTRDEIFEVFWPKMPVKEATNVFHVTKRKISERLGHELTHYSGGFYVPSPRLAIHYDVRVFETAMQQAADYDNQAPAYWYQAIQLYRSEFLPGLKKPWVVARREVLKHKYAQALIGLGRYYRALNEPDRALGYLIRALREKPDWEDVHRDVMMIYYQQQRRDEAIAQYEQLAQTLQTMFGIQPSKDTRNLYEVIAAI